MNSIWNKNFAAYRNKHPESASFLETLDTSHYLSEKATDGSPVIKIKMQDGLLDLDDSVAPRKEALSFVPKNKPAKNLFVIMGMGSGYLLQEAHKR